MKKTLMAVVAVTSLAFAAMAPTSASAQHWHGHGGGAGYNQYQLFEHFVPHPSDLSSQSQHTALRRHFLACLLQRIRLLESQQVIDDLRQMRMHCLPRGFGIPRAQRPSNPAMLTQEVAPTVGTSTPQRSRTWR